MNIAIALLVGAVFGRPAWTLLRTLGALLAVQVRRAVATVQKPLGNLCPLFAAHTGGHTPRRGTPVPTTKQIDRAERTAPA